MTGKGAAAASTSPASYPTSRPVLRGPGLGNEARLPDSW